MRLGEVLPFPSHSSSSGNFLPGVCTPPSFLYLGGTYYSCGTNGAYTVVGGSSLPDIVDTTGVGVAIGVPVSITGTERVVPSDDETHLRLAIPDTTLRYIG